MNDSYGSGYGQTQTPFANITSTPDHGGYWLVGLDGGVFTYGDAPFYGSIPGSGGSGGPQTVALVPDASTGGYWEVDADGGVFSYHATYHGSLPGIGVGTLAVVDAGPYGTDGYCMLWNTGRVDCFLSNGSHIEPVGPVESSQAAYTDPVVSMSITSGGGIWTVSRRGVVRNYGNASYEGELYPTVPTGPIMSISGWSTNGYRFVGADGGTFDYNIPYEGNVSVGTELSASAAQAYGHVTLPQGAWGTAAEWSNGLYPLWQAESGWSWSAYNPTPCSGSDHAYGIPQACPGQKMCYTNNGQPPCPSSSAWQTNAWTQEMWGFWYIDYGHGYGVFSDPEGAWAYDQSHGGYQPTS